MNKKVKLIWQIVQKLSVYSVIIVGCPSLDKVDAMTQHALSHWMIGVVWFLNVGLFIAWAEKYFKTIDDVKQLFNLGYHNPYLKKDAA